MPTVGFDRQGLFDRAVDEFGPALWRLTAGYASEEADRKDLHQEILMGIWTGLARFRGSASLRTFVYRIAHNRGLSYRSYERRRVHSSIDTATDAYPSANRGLIFIASRR